MSRLKNHNNYLEDRDELSEGEEAPSTKHFEKLWFRNAHTKREYSFYCFREDELKLPAPLAQKTIAHVSSP